LHRYGEGGSAEKRGEIDDQEEEDEEDDDDSPGDDEDDDDDDEDGGSKKKKKKKKKKKSKKEKKSGKKSNPFKGKDGKNDDEIAAARLGIKPSKKSKKSKKDEKSDQYDFEQEICPIWISRKAHEREKLIVLIQHENEPTGCWSLNSILYRKNGRDHGSMVWTILKAENHG